MLVAYRQQRRGHIDEDAGSVVQIEPVLQILPRDKRNVGEEEIDKAIAVDIARSHLACLHVGEYRQSLVGLVDKDAAGVDVDPVSIFIPLNQIQVAIPVDIGEL